MSKNLPLVIIATLLVVIAGCAGNSLISSKTFEAQYENAYQKKVRIVKKSYEFGNSINNVNKCTDFALGYNTDSEVMDVINNAKKIKNLQVIDYIRITCEMGYSDKLTGENHWPEMLSEMESDKINHLIVKDEALKLARDIITYSYFLGKLIKDNSMCPEIVLNTGNKFKNSMSNINNKVIRGIFGIARFACGVGVEDSTENTNRLPDILLMADEQAEEYYLR